MTEEKTNEIPADAQSLQNVAIYDRDDQAGT